ncbi:hypothetical protein [Amycolatopsis sp. CA-126428]|uniref:hypothetical protein n=1 Tax=Amycolatopsis sp. CA-126428 TaxID=2073158 RepID=UPI000CD09EA3|nr:hypothetical protein [Amycolatopsis sp. CA-126428]
MVKDGTMAKSGTRKVAAAVAAAASVAGMVFAAAPATAAAYPTSTFTIKYGASYYSGTVIWQNRSVAVTGTFNAVGCRRVYALANSDVTQLDYRSSSTHCNSTAAAPFALTTDVAGGANNVGLWMTTENPNDILTSVYCYRGDSVCG